MPDYAVTGKKGTGKSKNAVRIAREVYLKHGRRVASNLDLDLVAMLGPHSRVSYVRVPDKPTAADLLSAGHGNPDSYDEEKNGALILDECATWLNARTFGDKDRNAMIDFMAHARKHGWDTYYIMQDVAQVDKQVRESFIEYTVRHRRYDRVKWPVFGGLLALLLGSKAAYMPRFHTAVTRIGCNPMDLKTDSLIFRGDDLHKCYDTRQVFQHDYPHGSHSVLSPWHTTGRFMAPAAKHWSVRLREALLAMWNRAPSPRPPVAPKSPLLQLVMRLPPDRRIAFLKRYPHATF